MPDYVTGSKYLCITIGDGMDRCRNGIKFVAPTKIDQKMNPPEKKPLVTGNRSTAHPVARFALWALPTPSQSRAGHEFVALDWNHAGRSICYSFLLPPRYRDSEEAIELDAADSHTS